MTLLQVFVFRLLSMLWIAGLLIGAARQRMATEAGREALAEVFA